MIAVIHHADYNRCGTLGEARVARHVFIDNSNIFGGAQRAGESMKPPETWPAVRVYYRNLFALLEHGGETKTRIMAGSVPPANELLWEHARAGGYNTDLLRRVEDDNGRMVEQGVDELLHMKIALALLDHEPPQTLVIAGGDGAESDFGTSFPDQVLRALKRGWNVEVWSFHSHLTKQYQRFFGTYQGMIHVHSLDAYYNSITFARAGTYRNRDGAEMVVPERVVAPLRLT